MRKVTIAILMAVETLVFCGIVQSAFVLPATIARAPGVGRVAHTVVAVSDRVALRFRSALRRLVG